MARFLTCPHGHQWELPEGELLPGDHPVCPVCVSGQKNLPSPPESAASRRTIRKAEAVSEVRPYVPGYEIREVLGRGGMGVVYRAWQVSLKRDVALKMILAGPYAGAEELARFRTEAEAAARLRHPHVVQIHEIGEHEGRPFLALEYVDGGSLAQHLSHTLLPAAAAAELVETLARAMHAAHGLGIIHRDLKPANILLQKNQTTDHTDHTDPKVEKNPCDPWFPKIADFGLAKQLDAAAGQTESGAVLGTPSYMAPEQAAGKTRAIGPATDVYALGVILYEALTGRPPFKAATVVETLDLVRFQEPLSPRSLQPKLPRDLETICLKCLHKMWLISEKVYYKGRDSCFLSACLQSAAGLVDEIIVVDTGSTDGTREVAARLGARVFDFPWCDSFSAARNESLRHATGDWIFWLDGDERRNEPGKHWQSVG